MKKKTGFTLAEVLITISIIGVVAVMVMPILSADVNKQTWTNGLKAAISNLSNAFEQMMAIDITSRMEGTNLWENVIHSNITSSNNAVREELGKYLVITNMETGVPSDISITDHNNSDVTEDLSDTVRFTLGNGTAVNMQLFQAGSQRKSTDVCNTIKSKGGTMCSYVATMYVDVNGKKRPNKIGSDIYYFYLGSDGRLYPYGGLDVSLFESDGAVGGNGNENQGKDWQATCDGKPLSDSCDSRMLTARVIDEGFSIKY